MRTKLGTLLPLQRFGDKLCHVVPTALLVRVQFLRKSLHIAVKAKYKTYYLLNDLWVIQSISKAFRHFVFEEIIVVTDPSRFVNMIIAKEQDKSSDIEQQQPFGDRKYSKNCLKGGGLQNQREHHNLDKV